MTSVYVKQDVKQQSAASRAGGAGDGRVTHISRRERAARGKAARAIAPLDSHAIFEAAPDRTSPVDLLLQQARTRVPELVPIRHGRMLVSPFTYYRGAALPMAADLALTPSAGLRVQACGDAHLSNFGMFASPERRMVFDLNDFDETVPGPFEWDVKRLAASFEIAGRDNGFKAKECRKIALAAGREYRRAMRGFAEQDVLSVWYAHLDVEQALAEVRAKVNPARFKKTQAAIDKARTRDVMKSVDKLTVVVDGSRQILSSPPLIVPLDELLPEHEAAQVAESMHTMLRRYRRSLPSDRRHLLERFTLVDLARKVVGVGSVGTRAYVLLMQPDDGGPPLFLQAKQAEASVLEEFCGRSKYTNHGARVVAGQHLMQAASDIFLGFERVISPDGIARDFYVRQLRDWKFSLPVEQMAPTGMALYAGLCAWTLARAHARSGDRIAIAAYLGHSETWDHAIADFAVSYANQNEKDYQTLKAAVADGLVSAESGV
jgi:uncharacterized protein (DUF2252 family)